MTEWKCDCSCHGHAEPLVRILEVRCPTCGPRPWALCDTCGCRDDFPCVKPLLWVHDPRVDDYAKQSCVCGEIVMFATEPIG